jgi:DNA-binding PadR family transcriptional regulator
VLVLAVLSQLRTMRYGYELRQRLAVGGMPIEEGTLYPLLRRLESQGLLTSRWEADEGAPRRYYALSSDGKAMYDSLIASWRSITEALDSLLEGDQA